MPKENDVPAVCSKSVAWGTMQPDKVLGFGYPPVLRMIHTTSIFTVPNYKRWN